MILKGADPRLPKTSEKLSINYEESLYSMLKLIYRFTVKTTWYEQWDTHIFQLNKEPGKRSKKLNFSQKCTYKAIHRRKNSILKELY